MKLNEWAVGMKTRIFDDLAQGKQPSDGSFDEAMLRAAQVKGKPQMGTTTYEHNAATFEFIFPDASSTSTVLQVRVDSPERIVFMHVPEWVLEEIWQGDVSGSAHFESEAAKMLSRYSAELEAGANEKYFGPQPAKRRE